MATATRPITIAEFARLPEPSDGSRLELVRGTVIVMPPPKGRHGIICSRIAWLLMNHVEPNETESLTGEDVLPGFSCRVAELLG